MDEFEMLARLGVAVAEVPGLRSVGAFVQTHQVALVRADLCPADRRAVGAVLLTTALQHMGETPAL